MAAASAMKAHGACIGTLALVLMGATSLYADDAPDLEEQIDASMFNAALKKPVIADSYLGDGIGSLNSDELCNPANPMNGCRPDAAVDGFAGNSHRWISNDISSYHWLVIDLERPEWVTSISIFAGRDEPGDGEYHPVSGLCSYILWAWIGDPSTALTPLLGASDDGWIEIQRQATETTEETHDNFAPMNTKFIKMTIDQSTCNTGPEYGCFTASCNNYAKIYEIEVFAAYPISACKQQVRVTGAGTADVNGVYFADGTATGVARYTKAAGVEPSGHMAPSVTIIRWNDGFWYISALGPDRIPDNGDDTDYYVAPQGGDDDSPPASTWRSMKDTKGVAPFPTVTISSDDACHSMGEVCRPKQEAFRDACSTCTDKCHDSIRDAVAARPCYDETCSFGTFEWYLDQAVTRCKFTDSAVDICVQKTADFGHTEVAYWPFSLEHDGRITDIVSHHDGFEYGEVYSKYEDGMSADGAVGRGYVLHFDGSNVENPVVPGYVEVAGHSAFDLNTYTINFWLKPASTDRATGNAAGGGCRYCQALVGHGEDFKHDKAQYIVFLGPANSWQNNGNKPVGSKADRIVLWAEDPDDTDFHAQSSGLLQPDEWAMVTVMRSSDDVVSLFLNGALDSTHVGFNSAHVTEISHPLTLGCRTEAQSSYAQSSHAFRDGYIDFYSGDMDDVRIFNAIVSPVMVRAIHEQEAGPANLHSSGSCDPGVLEGRIEAVEVDCCAGHGDGACGDGPPDICTPECATSFLPIYTDCGLHGQLLAFDTPAFAAFATKCYSPMEYPDCAFADFLPIALVCSDLAMGKDDLCSSDCPSKFGAFMGACSAYLGATTQTAVDSVEQLLTTASRTPCGGSSPVPLEPPPPPPPCDLDHINQLCANDPQVNDSDPDRMCHSGCARAIMKDYDNCKLSNPDYAATVADLAAVCSGSPALRRCTAELADFEASLQAACACGDPGAPLAAKQADCRSGLPDRCSAACAEVYLPFFSTCGGLVWPESAQAGPQEDAHATFSQLCSVAAGTHGADSQCEGRTCDACTGGCGWCAGKFATGGALPVERGHCSPSCTTTAGECDAAPGSTPGGGH